MRKEADAVLVYGISFGKHLGHEGIERQKNIQDFLADVKEIEFQGEITRKRKKADQPIYYLRDVILRDQKSR